MSQYPPEWDTLEEEQPVIETEYQPSQEPPRSAKPRRPRDGSSPPAAQAGTG